MTPNHISFINEGEETKTLEEDSQKKEGESVAAVETKLIHIARKGKCKVRRWM